MHTSKQTAEYSGTTGVACKNLNRNYILIEKEPEYIGIIKKRLED
jgi:DNA modification methylase